MDRRKLLLVAGYSLGALAKPLFPLAATPALVLSARFLASLVASVAPADRLGTAFGVFNLIGGASLPAMSPLAGSSWEVLGGSAIVLGGATLTVICVAAAATLLPRARPPAEAEMTPTPTPTPTPTGT